MTIPTQDNRDRQAAKLAQLVALAFEEVKTPAYFDQQRLNATTKYLKFQTLIGAGFNESQALYLVGVDK